MNKLTATEILEFANDLDKIAVALGILRQSGKLGNGQLLSKTQKEEILNCQIKLFRSSSKFMAQAIALDVGTIKSQIWELRKASSVIEKTLVRIESVEKIIDFSALALSVSKAVASGNAINVSESLDELLEEISLINN